MESRPELGSEPGSRLGLGWWPVTESGGWWSVTESGGWWPVTESGGWWPVSGSGPMIISLCFGTYSLYNYM